MEFKYDFNEELLPNYLEDLEDLMDWSPHLLTAYLSLPEYDKFGYKDPERYTRIVREHNVELNRYEKSEKNDTLHFMDWEVEIFLRKYPYFKPLFSINENYVPPEESPKEKPKKGFFRRLFSRKK